MKNSPLLGADRDLSAAADTRNHGQSVKPLLTTKEVAKLTGLSTSYFEKGRIYNYGPKFIRLKARGQKGKVLYRRAAVEEWLAAQELTSAVVNHEQ